MSYLILVLVKTNKLVFSCIDESPTGSGAGDKSNLPNLGAITNFFNKTLIINHSWLKFR
jgi:hypothetical protein